MPKQTPKYRPILVLFVHRLVQWFFALRHYLISQTTAVLRSPTSRLLISTSHLPSPKHYLPYLNRSLLSALLVFGLVLGTVYTYTRTSVSERVSAAPGINRQINFQGKLVNPNGTNVTDGSYSIVFSIYTVSSAGTAVWTETQTPTITNGIFQVNLGSVTALPGSVDFNTDNLYLGIRVGADAEMTPRVQFTAVPQAFNAERLGGLTSSGFIQNTTTQQAATNFNIAGTGVIGTSLTTPILQSAPATGLTITGNATSTISTTAGNLNLQAGGTGTINLTPSSATALVNVLTGNLKVGDGTPTVALNGEDAYIEGTLEVDGTTRFDGAITATAGLTITAGGASITGNSTITGTLTGLTGLTVASGGASIAGNTTIATTAGNTLSIGNATGTLTVTGSSASSFVFNGTTVTATEFNRLDGKDAALVDTNDAVATAITGTGALNSGSITSGFGTINNADTITGTTINGTTGINTGAGAGTQRIDASGNLVNVGTYSGTGNITTTGGTLTVQGTGTSSFVGSLQIQGSTLQRSNLFPDFTRSFGGGTDLNWKKAADVVIAGGNIFAAASFQVDVIDANSNYGATSDVIPMRFYVSAVRSTGTQDVPDSGSVAGPSTDYVRLVKTSLGVYEIQVRQPTNFRDLDVTIRELSENGSTTVTYNAALTDGSVTGTIYTPSVTGYTQEFANIDVNGNLLTAGTTRLTAAGVLQNVTNADAGTFFTGGTLSAIRGGTGLNTYAVGDLLFANTTTSLSRLAAVASGSCLISQGVGVAPVWGSCATGGGITGSGTNGQVTYFNGTSTVTSGANLLFNGTTLTANTLAVSTGGLTVTAGGASITGTTTINTTGTAATSIGNATGVLTVTGALTSNFVIGGVTVSGAELNLLDGKNAPLVDTNDATTTAITGTGALNSGSITSGFGTINNADTITGTTINGTTGINTGAGAGVQRLTAAGALTNITTLSLNGAISGGTTYTGSGNITTTGGVLNIQGAGTSLFSGNVQVGGALKHYDLNNVIGATAGWFRLGTLNLPQGGNNATIRIYAGAGYNADPAQNGQVELNIRTSNSSSVDANGFGATSVATRYGRNTLFASQIKLVSNAAGAAATTYDVYVSTGTFIGLGYYTVDVGAQGGWTHSVVAATDPGVNSSTVSNVTYESIIQNSLYTGSNGRVGVGTYNPQSNLHIAGTTGSELRLSTTSRNLIFGIADANGDASITGFAALYLGNYSLSNSTRVSSNGSLIVYNSTGTDLLNVNTTGTTVNVNGALNVTNTITGARLISTQATGTAPFTVSSTTKVTNLNADLLDGFDSTAFGDATAANQTTILGRIGTNADAAGTATLFARLSSIDSSKIGATGDASNAVGSVFARLRYLTDSIGSTGDAASSTGTVQAKLAYIIANPNGSGGGGSKSQKFAEFTANGSWTAPAGVTTVEVFMVGGGGGGASGSNSSSAGGCGGGGGGVIKKYATVTPSTVYSVVIGAGGAGGSGTNTGGAGGSSTFAGISAGGGSGGTFNFNVCTGGLPGDGGGAGGRTAYYSNNQSALYFLATDGLSGTDGFAGGGGGGGVSSGSLPPSSASDGGGAGNNGNAVPNRGGGGGGGRSNLSANGGNGGSGYLLISWWE